MSMYTGARYNLFFTAQACFGRSMGYQKTQNFLLIPNSLKWAQKNYKDVFSSNFFRNIFLSPFHQIWNQHVILRFLIPCNNLVGQKYFRVILTLFANFECKYSKMDHLNKF